MAELTPRERLQPALLDRLTDHHPQETKEAPSDRVLNMRELRQSVLRDLGWLLNTVNYESVHALEDYPQVAHSVLNFGLPELSGRVVATLTPQALEAIVKQAILDFEPRILPRTCQVRAIVREDQMNRTAVGFEIEGELWAQPMPLRLLIKTEIDPERGRVLVAGQPGSEDIG